ncbi:MAG TPA: succinate dehydrogenase, cytochrome b556 subunit [Burkholderiales bacterium]|nr:succinate dehydrogenase, cytochrome b556 subunit [Burkholderiales bacterium]
MIASQRPKYLDLLRIRLPLPGLVSILHRISGAGLFALAWIPLYLLEASLRSPESNAHFHELVGHGIVKLVLIGMLWAFLHHFFAGLRFLLLDVHVASDLKSTRAMSMAVLALSLALTVIIGVALW